MGSNAQSHRCKMSKVVFSKADEYKKEMELFFLPPGAFTPVICIEKTMKFYQFHIYTTYFNAKLY